MLVGWQPLACGRSVMSEADPRRWMPMDRSSRSEVSHNTSEMPTDCRFLSVSASVGQLMSVGHLAPVHTGVQLSVSLASRR